MSRPDSPRMRKVNELLREVIAEAVTELKDPGSRLPHHHRS